MKKVIKSSLAFLLAFVMIFSAAPLSGSVGLKIPGLGQVNANAVDFQPGDIIPFGSYPQTKVTDSSLISALNAQTLGADDSVYYGGSRYKRVYFTQYTPRFTTGTTPSAEDSYQDDNGYYVNTVYWFKYEPIQWRVLSNTDGELFVLSEKILASRAYNQVLTNVTWETCTLRAWLRDDFTNAAFTPAQQSEIAAGTVVNADNPLYGTDGGNNTTDKMFLLSYAEAMNPAYGFSSSHSTDDTARRAQGSDFAKSNGLWVTANSSYLGNSLWWLRSLGSSQYGAGDVSTYGGVYDNGSVVHDAGIGVRPALKVKAIAVAYQPGDIIPFGSYPQTKVTDSSLISALNAQPLGADGSVYYGGSRYKRVYFTQYTPFYTTGMPIASNSYQDDNGYFINTVYWFKYEPIQWRVLSNTDGELFVLSEKILASRAYNQMLTNVTWETCWLRSWLRDEFTNAAFTPAQQSQIAAGTVVNADNPWDGTDGGNNTTDKVFLLSYAEVMNLAYGFSSSATDYDPARQAQGTDYAKSNGLLVTTNSSYLGNSDWWLRSPGNLQLIAGGVYPYGSVHDYSYGVNSTGNGVRPALKLNLTSGIFTSKAGSTCVMDYLKGFVSGLTPGITAALFESGCVQVAAGYSLEYSAQSIGTGTIVSVIDDGTGETAESYMIVIYGDVSGDGIINAIDADICALVQNWMIEWDETDDAAFIKAGDVNGDGRIDSVDTDIVSLHENWLVTIDQTTGLAT